MKSAQAPSVLVLSMPPWRFATRTRKGATEYARNGFTVSFLALQQVGRTGKRDDAGTLMQDQIVTHHVAVAPPESGRSYWAQAKNLLWSYIPSLARLTKAALSRRAEVVHVTGVPLIPVAILHSIRHGSRLIVDINERPASVTASGSLFSLMRRVEPLLIKTAAARAVAVTVVAPGHARMLHEQFGVSNAIIVRNAPEYAWRHGWVAPPEGAPLRVVTVGSLFPGRALEMLIRACGIANRQGSEIELRIVGMGAPEYVDSLTRLIESEGARDYIKLEGPVDRSTVSEAYTRGHVGLALYEHDDPGNDSLSNKIIETIASGRPVLAGDLPENREFVTSLGAGWLTSVDEVSIADAMQRISALDKADIRLMAEHCQSVASGSLAWESEFEPVLSAVFDSYRS